MAEILSAKSTSVEVSGLVDLAMLGGAKVIEERVTMPFIGNSSIMSGAIKIIAGSAVHSFLPGKAGKIVGGAFLIDGIEDVAVSLLGGFGQSSGSGGNQEAW